MTPPQTPPKRFSLKKCNFKVLFRMNKFMKPISLLLKLNLKPIKVKIRIYFSLESF